MSNKNITEYGKNTRFSSTNQPAKNGRKPSKLKKFIKDNNLSSQDISLMAKTVFEMDEDQLNDVLTDIKRPIIIRLFVKVLLQDLLNGNLNNWEVLMKRTFGEPPKEISFKGEIQTLSTEEREKRILELLKKRGNDV